MFWRYAKDHYRLVDKNLDPNIIMRLPRRVFIGILAYLIAMGDVFCKYSI
jgi:hypothetical protein